MLILLIPLHFSSLATSMDGSSSNDSGPVSLQTLLHLLTTKLSSINQELWKNQVLSILSYQGLLGDIDRSISHPQGTIIIDGKISPNDAFSSWKNSNQQTLLILQSSLIEEAMSEALGLTTTCSVWKALEVSYNHNSLERVQPSVTFSENFRRGTHLLLNISVNSKTFVTNSLPQVTRWTNRIKVTSFVWYRPLIQDVLNYLMGLSFSFIVLRFTLTSIKS